MENGRLNDCERLLLKSIMYATAPWKNSGEHEMKKNYGRISQEKIDFCLYHCPYEDDANACDRCIDGQKKIKKKRGRRPALKAKGIKASDVIAMRKEKTVEQIAEGLGVSKWSIYKILEKNRESMRS